MKILVFDDKEVNRQAAIAQLKGHELTVVGTYDEAQEELECPNFDVVLTDLLVPASGYMLDFPENPNRHLIGQEMPLGSIIALLAINRGVKRVAVVTDLNHHMHPAAAAFDCFIQSKCNGVRVVCKNSSRSRKYDDRTVKDWGGALEMLCEE